LGDVSIALGQAGELRKQLVARKKEAGANDELVATLQELDKKLEGAMETDADMGFGLFGLALPGKEHESLSSVTAALTGLLIVVDSSDLGATNDAAAASIRWEAAAQEALERWAALRKDDLASVNARLEKAKLKPFVLEDNTKPR
jgi:hypothetical protein